MSKQASDRSISPGPPDSNTGREVSGQPSPRMVIWQIVLITALVIALTSLIYQAASLAFSNKYQTWVSGDVRDSSHVPPIDLQLRIAYPSRLRFQEPAEPGRPISVWLWATQPITPSGVVSPLTYTVKFEPFDDGILFTDKEGVPAAPQVEIQLANEPGNPGLVYLKRAPSATEISNSVLVAVTIDGPSPSGISLQEPIFLTVKVEKRGLAGLRRFFDLLLGPTTFLLALLGGLVSFGLQQWVQQEEEKQNKERGQQAKLSLIQSLQILATQDLSEAVYQWWGCFQKTKSDSDWQKPEMKRELDNVWRRIEDLPWRLTLLRRAIRHLGNNEQAKARTTAELIHNITPQSPSLEALAARLLAAHLDGEQEVASMAFEIGLQDAIKASLWLHQEFGETVRPIVIPLLTGLAGQPGSIKEVAALLADSAEGRRLLREPEFDEPLSTLAKDPAVSQEVRDIAKELLQLRQVPYRWPPLWPAPRPTETPVVREWLELVSLKHNPFGPEQAELEPLLPDYGTRPSVLESIHGPLRGARPAILFGAPGSGRTATALLLAYDCANPPASPRERETFPVYYKLLLDVPSRLSRLSHLELIARAVGEALIRFLALNPYTFLEHKMGSKSAIAYLLTWSAGSPENLAIRLKQAGLSSEGAGQRLLEEITGIVGEITPAIRVVAQ